MKKMAVIASVALLLAGAAHGVPIVETYTPGSGTTAWVNTTSAVGDWSLQCNNPASGGSGTYAGVLVTNLGNPTIEDFGSWDYWTKSNAQYAGGYATNGVNVRLWLDTPYDNYPGQDWDVALNVMPHNTLFPDVSQPIPPDTWVNINSVTRYPYQFFAWDGDGNYLGGYDIATQADAITWAEFQALDPISTTWGNTYDFSEAIIRKASLRTGGGGIITDVTAYLDDFTLDEWEFILENGFTVVPEPASVSLLVLGGLAVLGRKRR